MTKPLKVTAKLVRAVYPNPTGPADDGYCVGGAFIRMLGLECQDGFPASDELRDALECYTGMPRALADDFAFDIITSNDAGCFDEAFDLLEAAIG